MQLNDLVSANGVWPHIKVPTKEKLLRDASRWASKIVNVEEGLIYKSLMKREELGSTGVGSGIALPHARLPSLKQAVGLLITFNRPIDFNSIDERPVDIVGNLLLPRMKRERQLCPCLPCASVT